MSPAWGAQLVRASQYANIWVLLGVEGHTNSNQPMNAWIGGTTGSMFLFLSLSLPLSPSL